MKRGEFSMTVLTRARAVMDGVPLRDEAVLVGMIHPDHAPSLPLAFVSMESVQEFIREMAPRRTTMLCVESEDLDILQASVDSAALGALH